MDGRIDFKHCKYRSKNLNEQPNYISLLRFLENPKKDWEKDLVIP
jgi:hypothetical protein